MPISMASCQFRFAICQFVALACLGSSALCAADDEGRVPIRENTPVGSATRIQVDLTAEGQYEPAPEQGTPAKPVPLRLQARVDFVERVLRLDAGSTAPDRAVRRIEQAVVAFGGGVRPLNTVLRPELGVVLAERGPHAILVQSLGGPLRREELSLLEFPGDPLTWFALLPEKPVAVGDRWSIRDQAVRSLSGYDAIAATRLEAKLDELTDREAVIVLGGEVRGASRGGEGTMNFKGRVRFDRTQERIRAINLERSEKRKPGPVEAGLDVRSTLSIERQDLETPPAELDDAFVGGIPESSNPERSLLSIEHPDGLYQVTHDRNWHLFWDDNRQAVLKRLDQGEVIAQ
jgi:hypothetical protein